MVSRRTSLSVANTALPYVGAFGGCNNASFSVLIWILAGWIIGLQIYSSFKPPLLSSSPLIDPIRDTQDAESHSRVLFSSIDPKKSLADAEEDAADAAAIAAAEAAVAAKLSRPKRRRRIPGRKVKPAADELEELAALKRSIYFPNLAIDPRKITSQDEQGIFYPGREWRDSDGKPIQAHGGCVIYVEANKRFYWYGENKDGPTYKITKRSSARVDIIGVSCYSSADLWLWKNEGLVLGADKVDKTSDLHITNVMERPKVIYNDITRQYVMWMHIDNANYSKASIGVAVSTKPEGPFRYLGSERPDGCESRDMTLFKDDDGKAYLIYSSEGNNELHVTMLRDDYLGLTNIMSRILINQHREAPAVFRHHGLYYMVTSGCTGWIPNTALVHSSESMFGPWQIVGDPCVGGSTDFRSMTFYSQSTFVLQLPGHFAYIFMADRWNPIDLRDSRYVWLPLTIGGPVDQPGEDDFDFPIFERVSIHWHRRWKLPNGWNNTLFNQIM